jgi:hypothetical protein
MGLGAQEAGASLGPDCGSQNSQYHPSSLAECHETFGAIQGPASSVTLQPCPSKKVLGITGPCLVWGLAYCR